MGKRKYKTEEEAKAAQKAQQAEWYQKNRNKYLAQQAERYKQNRDKIRAQQAEYYQNHKAERIEYVAEYRKNNRDKIRTQKAGYDQAHKAERAEYHTKYYSTPNGRAKNLLNAYKTADKKYNRGECTLTEEWLVDNVFSGQVCHYCGESDWTKLGVDRIDNSLPHTPENVVPCCGVCNVKRSATEYSEFMRLIGKIN